VGVESRPQWIEFFVCMPKKYYLGPVNMYFRNTYYGI
jgi:hypothetical protein